MVRCVEVALGPLRKICVTRGNRHVTEVLRALGIAELEPPAPPGDGKLSVVTKPKNHPGVFNSLRVPRANMRQPIAAATVRKCCVLGGNGRNPGKQLPIAATT